MIDLIPHEHRKITERLFPSGGYPEGKGPKAGNAAAFAEILGIGADYKRLLAVEHGGADMHRFLGHFRNNLDLLIQKTWVEKADEIRKEKLQDRIPSFIALIEAGDYQKALADFSVILNELAYLLFGNQSREADFTEYTFRIDTQMGLFWWYGGRIGCLAKSADSESLRAVLLIGICYLTNF
ncbi:hypothetical protein AGMMS49928_24870 [Spirochaetia bacterium]|nr:hypothetical protein AGMMS49928_24870 [Spirochaetia bacterium]